MSLANRVILVTGAAGSLGKAVSAAFANAGARLILIDVSEERLQAACPGDDGRKLLLATNLGDAAATRKAIDSAIATFGRIDGAINIAGGFDMGPTVHETPAALWQQMMDINVGTLLNVVQAVVPEMLKAGGGKIVNVAAMGGLSGKPNMAAYSVSKSAVIRITEAMSAELRERNINVNCVLPSIIDTAPNRAAMPDTDPKKWLAPTDLAAVIVFLASDESRAIHGAAIPVVGLS